ncbi:hypothetical protein LEP1GSC043_3722 [Leptospira weilii str. Ecochallenge]|uniref:Uncharacterized protein n=2 Tax=Leptospira weilii TaxID=28184 RepID=N1U6K1_9LEPT|nr:hypothetical protein LEP1GSC043_3722 [Leptospira weilii str. Ecochallenge]
MSEFRQIYLRIQVFVSKVMLERNTLVSYSPKLSYDPAHVKKRKNGNFGNFSFNKKLNFERIWFLLPDG